jgi:23S rRNA G2069 N7-methylase RlmK/C1962 C5-methylase RlmI
VLFNGAIKTTLIRVDQIESNKANAAREPRVLSDGAQMVANRLRKNLRNSRQWRTRENIACFRAYDADLPEYAAAIDVYEGAVEGSDAPPQTWLHVQEYQAPADIPLETQKQRLGDLLRLSLRRRAPDIGDVVDVHALAARRQRHLRDRDLGTGERAGGQGGGHGQETSGEAHGQPR